MERAKARWDSIDKPLGSLGALEEAIIRIAGMTGSADVDISKRAVVVMSAMRMTASSSAPRLPRGLAMESHRAFARSMAAVSAGVIPAIT